MATWQPESSELAGKSSKTATTSQAFSDVGRSVSHQIMSPMPTPSFSAVVREMMTLCARFRSWTSPATVLKSKTSSSGSEMEPV